MATWSVNISSITASKAIVGREWSRLKINVRARNLVPALLRMPSSRLLVCIHCSGRPTFKDHSLAIFEGYSTGYHCHCQELSDRKLGHQGRQLKLNPGIIYAFFHVCYVYLYTIYVLIWFVFQVT